MNRIETSNPDLFVFREPGKGWWFTLPLFVIVTGGSVYLMIGLMGVTHGLLSGVMTLAMLAFLVTKGRSLVMDWFVQIGCKADQGTRTLAKQWRLFVLPWAERTIPTEPRQPLVVYGIVTRYSPSGITSLHYYCDLMSGGKRVARMGRADTKESLIEMAIVVADALWLDVYDATFDPPKFIHSGLVANMRGLLRDNASSTESPANSTP